MTTKRTPHHDLAGIRRKFSSLDTLEITTTARLNAAQLGYGLDEIVLVVQQLEKGDFVSSSTAHNPANHRIWHDTYVAPFDGRRLYLKFAGETLVDVALVSFKEAGR